MEKLLFNMNERILATFRLSFLFSLLFRFAFWTATTTSRCDASSSTQSTWWWPRHARTWPSGCPASTKTHKPNAKSKIGWGLGSAKLILEELEKGRGSFRPVFLRHLPPAQKSGSPSLLVISNPLESDFQKKVILRFFLVFFCRKIKIQSGGFAAFGAKRSETRFASSLTMFFKFSFFHFSTKVDSLFLAVSFPRF